MQNSLSNTPKAPLWLLAIITIVGTLAMHMFIPALPDAAKHLGASNAQMLQQLLLIGAHGLPRNFDALVMQAQQLTPAHIKAVINRYLKADQWVITSHGPTTTQRPLPVPAP